MARLVAPALVEASRLAHRAIFKSRRLQWPVEQIRTTLGDGHGIEQKDEATGRDADRNGAL